MPQQEENQNSFVTPDTDNSAQNDATILAQNAELIRRATADPAALETMRALEAIAPAKPNTNQDIDSDLYSELFDRLANGFNDNVEAHGLPVQEIAFPNQEDQKPAFLSPEDSIELHISSLSPRDKEILDNQTLRLNKLLIADHSKIAKQRSQEATADKKPEAKAKKPKAIKKKKPSLKW